MTRDSAQVGQAEAVSRVVGEQIDDLLSSMDRAKSPTTATKPRRRKAYKDKGGRRRVVVTGLGAITPIGLNVDEFWQNLLAGKPGIDHVTLCDVTGLSCRIAGEVKGFDPQDYIDYKEARRMARFSQFAVAATRQAIDAAGLKLDKEDLERIGIIVGNGIGGFPEAEVGCRTLIAKGGMRMNPLFMPIILPNMAAGQISLQFRIKGLSSTVTTACAAATQAIGDATEAIRHGRADVMVACGTEAGITPTGMAGFSVMKALSSRNDEPSRASRPFDAQRDGFVPGEGAGTLILESLDRAVRRKAPILAEIAGVGLSSDAYHVTAPSSDGAVRAMRDALNDARIEPEEVDYINAHGTSTPLNDASETAAIKKLFGSHAFKLCVSSTKSMIGHLLGGSGGPESIACIKTILESEIHPTINYEFPDPECDLDYVPNKPVKRSVSVALSNSFGFGGQNACLIFKRFED